MVLKNNLIVGSVNANKRHWYKAGQNLARSDRAWLSRVITRRVKPESFQQALERLEADSIVELDDERKAAMVSNLLVVLCSDRAVTPVVNAGTLYNG